MATGRFRFAGVNQTGMGLDRSARGDLAGMAAESAIEEMLVRLRVAVRRKGDPVFTRFREELRGTSKGSRALPEMAAAPLVRQTLGRDEFKGVTLYECSADIAFWRPFEDLPYEKFGQVLLTARLSASAGSGPRVIRRVTISYEFKFVLASAPRPFGQSFLFVADGWTVTDLTRVNQSRTGYLRLVDDQAKMLEKVLEVARQAFRGRQPGRAVASPKTKHLALPMESAHLTPASVRRSSSRPRILGEFPARAVLRCRAPRRTVSVDVNLCGACSRPTFSSVVAVAPPTPAR